MKPYYDEDGITIYHGDARDIATTLSTSRSFDFLVTDPPYGKSYVSNNRRIKFGAIEGDETINTDWVSLVRLLVKDNAPVYVFADDDSICEVRQAIRAIDWRLNRMLVWDKGGMTHGDLNDYASRTEYVISATAHPQGGRQKPFGLRDSNLIHIPKVPPKALLHPAQKPEALLAYLITRASKFDDVLFDPFMGSGTALLAARSLGRRAVGIEIEERYCELAAKRLAQGVLAFGEGV